MWICFTHAKRRSEHSRSSGRIAAIAAPERTFQYDSCKSPNETHCSTADQLIDNPFTGSYILHTSCTDLLKPATDAARIYLCTVAGRCLQRRRYNRHPLDVHCTAVDLAGTCPQSRWPEQPYYQDEGLNAPYGFS